MTRRNNAINRGVNASAAGLPAQSGSTDSRGGWGVVRPSGGPALDAKDFPDLSALSIKSTRGSVSATGQGASNKAVNQTEPIPNGRSSASLVRKSGQKSQGNRYKKFPIHAPAVRASPSQAPTTFPVFSLLPRELRQLIWRHALDEGKIIEMEFGPDYNAALGVSNDSHSYYRVCPRSRQSPAVMRTCHEAREEGKLYLEERMFDKDTGLTGTSAPHRVWYNPRADTLFFGENTCISTLIHVFHSATQPIPSIAVMCSARGEQCCSHDAAVDAPGSMTMLQVIHGFEQSLTSLPRRFGGCPGLEEIHFKVNSKLWPRNAGDVDSRVAFRPASGNGLTKGQIAYKRRVESGIEYVAVHVGVSGCGDSLWSGDNRPAFLFSSFAPKAVGTEDKAFGGLMLTHKNIRKLEKGHWEFVKGVERDTGCRVEVLPEEYRGEDTREIGLTGTQEAVARAKELLEKKLALSSA